MSDREILFEEPGESAHLCSFVISIEHANNYTLIRIVAADSIRDFIRTKISDSQVPRKNVLIKHDQNWTER